MKQTQYPNLRKYIQEIFIELIEKNVRLTFSPKRRGLNFFCEDVPRIYSNGYAHNFLDWAGTFIHEYKHFKQWEGKDKTYVGSEVNKAFDRFYKYLDRVKDGDTKKPHLQRLKKDVRIIQKLELTCEKEVATTIKKYKLEIDYDNYIRGANAYLYSYPMIAAMGKFFFPAPSSKKEIIDLMPSTFQRSYLRPPEYYIALVEKYCLKESFNHKELDKIT